MKLLDYIETYGFRKKWFAQQLQMSYSALNEILFGSFPSRENAMKIVDLTERRVSYDDLYLEKKSLKEYIEEEKILKKIFAMKIGIDPINLSRLFRQDYYPNYKTVKKIIKETNGQIGFSDLWEKSRIHD